MTVLFVIATIILFLSVDWMLERRRARQEARSSAASAASPAAQPTMDPYPVRVPDGIFFAPSHTWLNLFPSGKLRLGVDDFIARLVSRPQIVLLKNAGDKIAKGDPIILLKETDHLLTVRSPLSGEILETNEELTRNPSYLRERLFGDGWGYTIKPEAVSELKSMMIGGESRTWIRGEFSRLRNFFAEQNTNGALQPAYLQDGGAPAAGALGAMDDRTWHGFEDAFLKVQ
jgi:glycine cleavage system H protein